MPFSEEEEKKLIDYFATDKLNLFALIIAQKVFENLTLEENKNWFDKILKNCENAIKKTDEKYLEAVAQSTDIIINNKAIEIANELFQMFQNMALQDKFKKPPIS